MNVLLLAAGNGTRLRPITNTVPKCLVPINGQPLLDIWLRKLSSLDVKKIIINTHHFSEMVESFINDSYNHLNIYISHEEVLLGTAGTVKSIFNIVKDEPLIVIHADNLSVFDFDKFIEAHNHREDKIDITMMAFYTDDPSKCGILDIDEYGIVINMFEKHIDPPGFLANAAIYIFEPSVLEFISRSDSTMVDISLDLLPLYINRIKIYLNNIYHRDIGTIDSYKIAQQEYLDIIKPDYFC